MRCVKVRNWPLGTWKVRSIENTTSSAVSSVPSWKRTPRRSLNSQVVASTARQETARPGMRRASSSTWVSASNTCQAMLMFGAMPRKCGSIEVTSAARPMRSSAPWAGRPHRIEPATRMRSRRCMDWEPRLLRGKRPDDLEHLSEDFRVAADDAARIDVARVAAKIPDQAPGLLHEQGACRHVPGRKAHFPESVEPSRGHVGDVERRGARAAQAGGANRELAEHGEILIEALEIAKGETGADQRLAELHALGDTDAPLVQVGAAAASRGEQLVIRGIVDHAVRQDAFVLEADRDRVLGEAVNEIGGAVERVDDPGVLGIARVPGGGTGLLC